MRQPKMVAWAFSTARQEGLLSVHASYSRCSTGNCYLGRLRENLPTTRDAMTPESAGGQGTADGMSGGKRSNPVIEAMRHERVQVRPRPPRVNIPKKNGNSAARHQSPNGSGQRLVGRSAFASCGGRLLRRPRFSESLPRVSGEAAVSYRIAGKSLNTGTGTVLFVDWADIRMLGFRTTKSSSEACREKQDQRFSG